MAELDELDELLSGSLKRAAQPGDSAGVADAIRARVAAGDAGTPAPSGTAPGWGGSLGWIPWVGAIVVAGLLGGALGVTGAVGHPIEKVTVAESTVLTARTVDATSCPGGPVVASVARGSRVVALARSADSAAVQVRNPIDVRQQVWIPAAVLVSDSGESAVASLPVGDGCPSISVAQAPVSPIVPMTPVAPTKPKAPAPAPVPDTTKPVFGAITFANTDTCNPVVTAQISDNVAVTSATIKWDHPANSTGSMALSGGSAWKATLTLPTGYGAIVNVSIAARDAAGNTTIASSKFVASCPLP